MERDSRRYLRDIFDELDRYFDEFEKSIQDSVRATIDSGAAAFSRPVVSGVAMGLTPEGKPSVQFFGDRMVGPNGHRTPIYEQVVDDGQGTLKLTVELPGVEKESIDVSATDGKVVIRAEQAERKYEADIPLEREIDAESGNATFHNGILSLSFSIRDKDNKGYRRVSVV